MTPPSSCAANPVPAREPPGIDQHILVLAAEPHDAQVIVDQLAAAGIAAQTTSASELVAAIRDSTLGAVLLTGEAFIKFDIAAVIAAVEAQPAWSDCPVLLLTSRDIDPDANHTAIIERTNVTLLERPLQPESLIIAARAALRARARQRRAEAHLRAQVAAEAQVRELAASLEARVDQRTTALTQEIERRTQAEALLRQSEELYRFTIDLNAQVPWSSTANGTPISIGERWTEVSGISFKEFTVRGWKGIAHADDYDVIAKARASVIVQGSPFDMEFRVRTADGSYRWLRSRGAPRRDADGKVLQWYGTIENVDARRKTEAEFNRLQSELIHVSRVSAMGTMASTLAHELNQPLTAIANYVRGSRRMLGELTGETVTIVQDALAQADASANKAGEIVRRLRELVASGDVQRRAESIPDLVRQASNMVLDDARSLGIAYTIDLDPQAATANADRIQVQQVLINLLRNAVEALSPTGVRHIVIQTRRVGAHCEISVRDTGPGISGEVAKRLFEPFYSTKSACMGVGLSISRTIVEAHGGQIWHDPHPGGGTTFRFTLPVAPVSITGAAAPAGAKPA